MYLKHCEIVIDEDKLKVDIQQTCMEYKSIKQWAYILHDKDDTRPHYHIYLNFGSSGIDTKNVANWFKLYFVNDKGEECTGENFIQKIKGKKTDMLLYLTHGQPDQKYKYQYDPTEVHANFDFREEIKKSKIIGDFTNYSYAQMITYIKTLNQKEQIKAYRELEGLWKIHCKYLNLNPNRNIEVVFIYGEAGTGKTTYAKRMLDKLGYDYAISSSSNDPLQDYMGQKALILDDLRDSTFEYEDLLKMLDNNTRTSVKSRFENKTFNGNMIVITSPVPIHKWYTTGRDFEFDKLNQLYRRISTYIITTAKFIEIYDGVKIDGHLKQMTHCYANHLIKKLKQKDKSKTDLGNIFRDIVYEDPDKKEDEATQVSLPGLIQPLKKLSYEDIQVDDDTDKNI